MGNKLKEVSGINTLEIGGLCYTHTFKKQNGEAFEIDSILLEHYVFNLTDLYDSVDDFAENYSWKDLDALEGLKENQLFHTQTYSVHLDTGSTILAIVEVKEENKKILTKEEIAEAALRELSNSIFDLDPNDITEIIAEELELSLI